MNESFRQKLERVEVPTLGHFLESGFCAAHIRRLAGESRVVSQVQTVRIPDADAGAVNQAIMRAKPGRALVLDLCGDELHACVGAVTIAAVRSVGITGIFVNGVVTDLDDLQREGIPVYARGTSCLTTKRYGSRQATFDGSVKLGNVTVEPGDWVLADRNGVLVASDDLLKPVLDDALASDAAEPRLLEKIRAGEPLSDLLYTGE